MAKGSFNGLYTFQDVAKIYNIDSSTIRKQVQNNKFFDNEIKKFGKTWIITEQAMVSHFGKELFIAYKNHLREQEALEIKKLKEESKKRKELEKKAKSNKKESISLSSNEDEEVPTDNWDNISYSEKSTLKTFTF